MADLSIVDGEYYASAPEMRKGAAYSRRLLPGAERARKYGTATESGEVESLKRGIKEDTEDARRVERMQRRLTIGGKRPTGRRARRSIR